MSLVSLSPKYHSTLLLDQILFPSYRPFGGRCLNDPQITLNMLNSATSKASQSCFQVTGHFDRSTSNEPKMILNTHYKVKGTSHVLLTHQVPNFDLFHPTASHFLSYWEGEKHCRCYKYFRVSNLILFCFMASRLLSNRPFRDMCSE